MECAFQTEILCLIMQGLLRAAVGKKRKEEQKVVLTFPGWLPFQSALTRHPHTARGLSLGTLWEGISGLLTWIENDGDDEWALQQGSSTFPEFAAKDVTAPSQGSGSHKKKHL